MTTKELEQHLALRHVAGPAPDERMVSGCHIGDLLSWVMSHAHEDDAWITVMGNQNAVAVASLVDAACIILCEDAPLQEDARKQAEIHDILVFSSSEPAFALASRLAELLG